MCKSYEIYKDRFRETDSLLTLSRWSAFESDFAQGPCEQAHCGGLYSTRMQASLRSERTMERNRESGVPDKRPQPLA